MYKIHLLGLIIVYVTLLIFAVILLLGGYICDGHTCRPMVEAKEKTKTEKKEQLYLLDHLCEEGIWPFAYIASSILCGLFFTIFPIMLDVKTFTIIFLITFIVFFAIMGFFIHHYVIPIKRYMRQFIEDK